MAELVSEPNNNGVVDEFSTFASKLSSSLANQAVVVLQNALQREKDPNRRRDLLSLMAVVANQITPTDRSVVCGRLARLIADEFNGEAGRGDGWYIAKLAASTAKGMNPDEAFRFLADGLVREPERNTWLNLAEGLAAVLDRMDPLEADRACNRLIQTQLKVLLSKSRTDPSDNYKLYEIVPTMLPHLDPGKAHSLAWEFAVQLCSGPDVNSHQRTADEELRFPLTRVLADTSRTQIARRAALMTAAAIGPGMTGPMAALPRIVAEPFPCRLTTQELVELLKMPTCFGKDRRVVLDHLGNRYRRRFTNHWEFVRYARGAGPGSGLYNPSPAAQSRGIGQADAPGS